MTEKTNFRVKKKQRKLLHPKSRSVDALEFVSGVWELSQFFSVYQNDIDDFNFCSMQAMESKLLVGGKNIVDHTNEQQRALEQRRREISDQKVGGNHFLKPKTFLSFEQ